MPKGAAGHNSSYYLKKSIGIPKETATKHYYCEIMDCNGPLVEDTSTCLVCNKNTSKDILEKTESFFYIYEVRKEIKDCLEQPKVARNVIENCNKRNKFSSSKDRNLEDIMDGKEYQKLGKCFSICHNNVFFINIIFFTLHAGLNGYNLSCSLNTDGVKLFKSSKYSVWPIFISINEMDYKLRRKFTILVGLWFGKTKAKISTFLRPLIPQLNDLLRKPLLWNYEDKTYTSYIAFPIMSLDSAARCMLQGVKQYNGEYSCTYCVASGKQYGVKTRIPL